MTSPLVVPVCGYRTLSRLLTFSVCPATLTVCSLRAIRCPLLCLMGQIFPGCAWESSVPRNLCVSPGQISISPARFALPLTRGPKRCFTMPMRAIWTGSIAFGLVNVPVKAYGATEDHDIDLHQVHDKDGGRIRYERRCEVCGEKVAYKDLDKAFEDGERTIVLTDEDMDALPAEKSREIEVVQFVPAGQIDPLMLE